VLDELIARNLGVLSEARIEPGAGFTAVTGETGAGKTLLLGALRLLLGQSARSDLVGPFGDEAVVEGRFLRPDGTEIAAARRLTSGGRSRAYLDGSIASAGALDESTAGMVEIIAQHDQLGLTRPREVRLLVDGLLDEEGRSALDQYRRAYEELQALLADLGRIGGDRPVLERERDLLAHQAAEITAAGFQPGDDDELARRLGRLRYAETLRGHLVAAIDGLETARDGLGRAVGELRRASALDPSMNESAHRLEALESEAGDLARDLVRDHDDLDLDPVELELAEERMRTLADLRRRFGPSLQEVLEFAADAVSRAEALGTLLDRSDTLGDEIVRARLAVVAAGEALTRSRRTAATALTSAAIGHLHDLGFPDPTVIAAVEVGEAGPSGADTIGLWFASDSRLKAGEIGRVASGGELSRLVLALRLAGGAGEARTLVFDEIDAGVGGATALAVGRKLAALAETRQVLCVTHLPQVAAFADTHYVVTRDETSATVRRVEGGERVEELSRMLAGLPDSERGRQAADELLTLARGGA
jgi:DNA repair protein RecN (Recombination protein N)